MFRVLEVGKVSSLHWPAPEPWTGSSLRTGVGGGSCRGWTAECRGLVADKCDLYSSGLNDMYCYSLWLRLLNNWWTIMQLLFGLVEVDWILDWVMAEIISSHSMIPVVLPLLDLLSFSLTSPPAWNFKRWHLRLTLYAIKKSPFMP